MTLDLPVRSPTGAAWVSAIIAIVATGEVFYEIHKDAPGSFFGYSFADEALWPFFMLFALAGVVSTAWLVSLYVRPGRLIISDGVIRRVTRSFFRRKFFEAPLGSWRVRVVYFSEENRARRTFKRVEIEAVGYREVLLFTDFSNSDEILDAFDEVVSELGSFEVEVQSAKHEA